MLIDLTQRLNNSKNIILGSFSLTGHGSLSGVGRANNANNVGNDNNVNGVAGPNCYKRSAKLTRHSILLNNKIIIFFKRLNLANITKWQNTELDIVDDSNLLLPSPKSGK